MSLRSGESYSASEYLGRLAEFDPDARTTSFEGMVRVADNGSDLLYAHLASCQTWIALPLDQIESIEHLGVARCRDHAHAHARVTLKSPESAKEQAVLSLAALHQDVGIKLMKTANAFNSVICPPGQHPCFDAGTGKWTCCSD